MVKKKPAESKGVKPKQERKVFNILEHNLVPPHRILSDKEKEDLLAQFNISELQLPLIRAKDAVSKLVGAKPGDVLEITRPTHTGTALYYRRVIA